MPQSLGTEGPNNCRIRSQIIRKTRVPILSVGAVYRSDRKTVCDRIATDVQRPLSDDVFLVDTYGYLVSPDSLGGEHLDTVERKLIKKWCHIRRMWDD